MTITDFIAFLISMFLIFRGYMRGIMDSLLGPVALIVATVISIIYYQKTGNMIVSLIIGIIGPIILHLILKFFVRSLSDTKTPSFPSSVAGAFLTLAWGWIFIAFTLILLAVVPPMGKTLADIHTDVTRSTSYMMAARPIENIFFAASSPNVSGNSNNQALDAQSLAQDPRFQKIMQDPEVQDEINARDYAKLMRNPKVMELTKQIMSDPVMLKRVFALYNSQMKTPTNILPPENSPTAQTSKNLSE